MLRRARPLLGTLVEIGVVQGEPAPIEVGFAAIQAVQRGLSRFDPDSDIARFNTLAAGTSLIIQTDTACVLQLAQALHERTAGLFDVSLGTGPAQWHCEGQTLHKRAAGVQLDLGGIAKGHAVDQAVLALQAAGVTAGWVNAGGDLRVFGNIEVPLHLRDEDAGGVQPFAHLSEGAFATSHYGPQSRCQLHGQRDDARPAHVSVAAPTCLWADALTKIAALAGPTCRGLMDDVGATAWWH